MHLVGVEDALAVDGNLGVVRGARPASDDEVVAVHNRGAQIALHFDGMVGDKARIAFEHGHTIAPQLRLDDLDLAGHDRIGAKDQVLHSDLVFDRITASVKGALTEPAEIQNRFAEGLTGDGAGVHANSADRAFALDYRDLFAHLGGTDGGLLPGGTAADDDQVEGVVVADRHGHFERTFPSSLRFHPDLVKSELKLASIGEKRKQFAAPAMRAR